MLINDLDYSLPPHRIATHPASPRDHSRLLVYHCGAQRVEHRRFYELPEYLRPTDLLIVNDTRVLPAKLELRKTTGALIPGLFLAEETPGLWTVMLRTRGRAKPGDVLLASTPHPHRFELLQRLGEKGMWQVRVTPAEDAATTLGAIGHVPLPPYIEKMRDPDAGDEEAADRTSYQTVYANTGKSLAAPTAGLHFTPELLERIERLGVQRGSVDLEVGLGTFLPVETETLEAHPMHTEAYAVPAKTVAALRAQRTGAGRVVVVGTTAVRTLESVAPAVLDVSHAIPSAGLRGVTDLKISPGYRFELTDVLITNFHLPRSTLMALVAAMITLEKLKDLYALAIREGYRFYSYGDAMLILP